MKCYKNILLIFSEILSGILIFYIVMSYISYVFLRTIYFILKDFVPR